MGDLLRDERLEIRAIAHAVGFGTSGEVAIESAHRGEMQAAQHPVEIMHRRWWRGRRAAAAVRTRPRRGHDTASLRAMRRTTYSDPMRRWKSARWSTSRNA